MSISIENDSCFLPLNDIKQQISTSPIDLSFCFDTQLFLSIHECGIDYILADDLPFYIRLLKLNTHITDQDRQRFGNGGNLFSRFLKLSEHTVAYLPDSFLHKPLPAFVRNLFYYSDFISNTLSPNSFPTYFEIMGIIIVTYETTVINYLNQVVLRKKELDRIRHLNFVNTAAYMGNKKRITGFIIESIFPYVSESSIFLDLMCGSGSMSQAFAKLGPTYASDAQEFCQLLAKIQGSGFSKLKAQQVLKNITTHYNQNFQALKNFYQEEIKMEEALYHKDWSDRNAVFSAYTKFFNQFSLYSSSFPTESKINTLILQYRANPKQFPYCLFTLYFSNIFFGLLQCIQLDSLRYAIDQLNDEEKNWALGVLVVTTYQVSSNHAGHFAQPKKISPSNVLEILSQREKSVYHEFSKRLLSLSEESERCKNEIKLVPGPWQNALSFAEEYIGKQAVVYLDAPYKRDEYSRYYHVLETLVKYDYPFSELNGRMPSKQKGERFSTEFFTKVSAKIDSIFVQIIIRILKAGMICAWSYSNNGNASIINVLTSIKKLIPCRIHLYSVPYLHQSQRKNGRRLEVTEYCIIISPLTSN